MPIFEYICRDCREHFEMLVTAERRPSCPSCRSEALDKQLSVFAVATPGPRPRVDGPAPCGRCGDPRGAGACGLD